MQVHMSLCNRERSAMKRYFEGLTTVLLAGTLFLGTGGTLAAQDVPPASQQPMEIPVPYPQQQSGPGGPMPGPGPQQQPNAPQQGDPGAARVSFMHGDVSTQHSGSNDWAAATLNTPVVSGDHISTGKDSRVEIQLDHANILRLSDESAANVVSLSRTQMQIQAGQGLVNFDALKSSDANVEIDTPNVAIHPQMGEGSLRIQINSDGETVVDVRNGSADISTPQGSTHVERDQRITIQGSADNAQYQVSGAPGKDDWDRWNSDRDHSIESARSWQHTNPYYTGSQDLDTYGQWSTVPDYGSVWFPATNVGWAPYRDGRWVYEPYYGWTWVSYEPWGWAPYHYGRWFVYGGAWGWWPGPVYVGYRPLWAPAYVSFLGFGGRGWGVGVGFGFGGGFGSVGWLPVGPGDRFYPWYGRGVGGVNVVNVYNIHNNVGGFAPLRGGPNAYSNVERAGTDERVRGGISSMQADQFGRGRVPTQQARVDEGSFRQASMMTGANPVSPSRESFHPTDRQVSAGTIPRAAASNQRFFSSSARQGATGKAGSGQGGFNRGVQGSSGQSSPSSQPGWRSFGSSRQSSQPGTEGRSYSGSTAAPPRSNYSQPAYSQPSEGSRQPQSYSHGGSGSNYGYSRPPLNMQQPVVTPRTGGSSPGSYSASRSAPSSSGTARGAAPSGGGSRGGSSSGGGHSSSGHSHH
jgi:hypothetical protein